MRLLLQAKVVVTVGKAAIPPDRPASDASSGHVRLGRRQRPPFKTSSRPHSDTAYPAARACAAHGRGADALNII
jgi:hypothetical protein